MIGTILNYRYRLEEVLGQGGMGVIYRSHDLLLERDVAVKLVSSSGLGSEGRAQLLHEAKAVARLNHPNIVSVFDAGEANGSPYIVMELLHGDVLFNNLPVDLADVIRISRQICAALEHAHKNGIVHRDLKPENVLVLEDGTIKLMDFGLARSVASRFTSDGMIVGTVYYMAPEIALRAVPDDRSDLYSLGVMMYEMACGQIPFKGDDPLAVISQHLYSPVIPPRAIKSNIPSSLDTLIVQLLSKRPEERIQSAEEVRKVLEILENLNRLEPKMINTEEELPGLNRLARGRLVGRERELSEMSAAWRQTLVNEGQTILVSGEPGIGKTRLVNELIARISVTGGKVVSGVCYAEGGMPYAPFASMILDSVKNQVNGLNLPDYVLSDLAAIVPNLQPSGDSRNPAYNTTVEQHQIFESVVAWAAALAEKNPLLLFLDDIHWADSGTLFLLRHMARRALKMKLLIVATYREVELIEASPLHTVLHDLSRERLSQRIKLTRFDRQQSREMLISMLSSQGDIAEDLVDAIYRETEGNPFFIEEVTKALIEEGKLCYTNECWLSEKIHEIDIPQSIRITIQTRLTRLPEKTQEVLRIASFLGREFEFETLLTASEIDEEDLIEAIENAERSQIIEEVHRGRHEQLAYTFVHALIPTTLKESTTGIRKLRMHRRVALAIEKVHPDDGAYFDSLAHHYEMAGEANQAFTYYIKAAERALAVYANKEAEVYYRAALELVDDGTEHPYLLAGLGEAMFRQGQFDQAGELWAKAIEAYRLSNNFDELARLYARRGRAAGFLNEVERGLAICLEGIDVLSEIGIDIDTVQTPGIASLLHETGRAYRFNDQQDKALPYCQKAMDVAEKLGLVEVQADSLATLGILNILSPEEAERSLEQAVELSESAGLLVTAIRAHTNLGTTYHKKGMLKESAEQFARGRELARRVGFYIWEFDQAVSLLDIKMDIGELAFVGEEITPLIETIPELPSTSPSAVWAYVIESRYYRLIGDWETALKKIADCYKFIQNKGMQKNLPWVSVPYALVLIEMDRLDEAEKIIAEELLMDQQPDELQHLITRLLLCSLKIKQGDPAEARRVIDNIQNQELDRSDWLVDPLIMQSEAGVLASEQRWSEAFTLYQNVCDRFSGYGAYWWQAYALLQFGDAQAACADPESISQAKQLYTWALDLFTKMPSEGYIRITQEKLRLLD